MSLISRGLFSTCVLAAFAVPGLAQASFRFDALGQVNATEDSLSIEDDQGTLTVSDSFGVATSTGGALFGVNKLFSRTDAFDPSTAFSGSISSAMSWYDTVTIDDPNLTGTEGTFTANLDMQGSVSAMALGDLATSLGAFIDAGWTISLNADVDESHFFSQEWSGAYYAGGGWADSNYAGYYGDDLGAIHGSGDVTFIYGQPFSMWVVLTATTSVVDADGVAGSAFAEVDMGHSVYWGGIPAIRDGNGAINPNATLSSGSGTNYLNPVPEPASVLAMAAGLAALLRRRRR